MNEGGGIIQMENNVSSGIRHMLEHAKQDMISTIDQNISPNINSRRSTLNSQALATVLAQKALKTPSEKTTQWIEMNAQGMHILGTPPFLEFSDFVTICLTILERICGVSLPPQLQKRILPVEDLAKRLDYPLYRDASYTLPFHLAAVALFCTIGGIKMPHILEKIYNLQQRDGSWTDDTINTALSAIALQVEGIEPKYDVQKWLIREMLPDGSWAVASGEVWEASYALRTGEAYAPRLVNVLTVCMHPNSWWGFSRYSAPDTDDTAVACYALAPYEPHLASRACENLIAIQDENGGWGSFPQIEGVIPQESVVGNPGTTHNDVTCHVMEVLEQKKMNQSRSFKKGISYLLESQAQDGHWDTRWWKSDIFGTAEIALLMNRHGYKNLASRALSFLERTMNNPRNIVEYALLIKAFSELPEYSDALDKAIHGFSEKYSTEGFKPTFDGLYPTGPIDYKLYRLSILVPALQIMAQRCRASP